VVEHVGSVAIVAIDEQGRVLPIRQYRHPAGRHLWELPAGLCDKPGETPLDTARRELAEENLTNGLTVAGVLAAAVGLDLAETDLRPADAPWPTHGEPSRGY
jgi:ADP-ribose pyrophosphatase YjhB (NUDIX family)